MYCAVATPAPRIRHAADVALTNQRDPRELSHFLPPKSDPDYLWVLSELVCDDLNQHWSGGHRRRLTDYRDTFPELFANPTILQPVADQEYALRKQAGETPNPGEYRSDFGVDPPSTTDDTTRTPLPDAPQTIAEAISPLKPFVDRSPTTALAQSFDEYESVPTSHFPKVGEFFQGFLLKDLLGRGSFAQVYVAEQVGLSCRTVALKVTRKLGREANRLARLQHANIVPIFSFHAANDWQAICMPYFGRQTLDHIVRHVRTLRALPKSGQEVFSTVANCAAETVVTATSQTDCHYATVKPTEAASRGELRNVLTHLTYVEASILLTAQIADGLVHAHSLNVLHLDLKPANVLISDHGQPMLLDFNLAYDRDREKRRRFGGTLPYMAPEQIAEMIQSRDRQANRTSSDTPRVSLVNEQSDLFAVGVMLFELLTGQLPFQSSPANADPYDFALAQRRGPLPSARAINPDVPVEVDAIVRSLLAPDRGDRYRSATALREDLLNHLEHRPLRHVRGTSLAGRVVKWHKRHPRAAIKAIAATAAVAAMALGTWGYWAAERKADLTAIQDVARARTELAKLQIDLAAPSETDSSRRGIVAARALFERFGISMGSDALDAPSLVRLPTDERARFLDELHDVAMLAAYADGVRGADRRTETHVANWQKLAAACGTMPADSTVRGAMLAGVLAMHDGRMTDASRQLEKVVASQPSNASGQFLFGIALLEQFQYRRAEERFAMAAALDPTDARAPYNRGLVLFYERKLGPALEAFSQALDRDPSMPDARLQRSLARFLMKDYDGSMEDALTAVKAESVAYRALALIAQIHDARGETDQAAAAHKKLASATPRTSADYFARGRMNVAEKKFTQALLDFRTATTLNPRYAAAWNNQAHVLGECLHETDQAIAAMDRAVEVNPQNGELYLGRAVLLARIGKRDAAHADVEKGRLLTDQPIPLYQAACVFSLTSRTHTADAAKAVAALCDAVKAGFRQPKTFATDPDLEPIRHLPEAKRIIDAAGSLVN